MQVARAGTLGGCSSRDEHVQTETSSQELSLAQSCAKHLYQSAHKNQYLAFLVNKQSWLENNSLASQ